MAINFWLSFVLSLDFAEHKTVTRLESKWQRNDSQYCVLNAWYLDTLSHRHLGDFDSTQCHLREVGLDPGHGSLLSGPLPFSSEPAVFSVVVDAVVYWPLIELLRSCLLTAALALWAPRLSPPWEQTHHKNALACFQNVPAASRAIWTSSWVPAPPSAHKPHDSYWRAADKSGHPKRMLMRATPLSVHWPRAKHSKVRGPNSHKLQQPSWSLITSNDWSVTWHLQRKENQRRGLLSCHKCWRIAARGRALE